MKLLYGLAPMLLTPFSVNTILDNIDLFSLDTLESSKVFEMNFDTNKNINIINSKEYVSTGTTFNYAPSLKGNGFETNGSKITIPFKDLGIKSTDTVLTVTFLMKHGGGTNIMPIGIRGIGGTSTGANDLWLYNGNFGFNTGNGDQYGIANPFKANQFYSVTAEFHANDTSKNKLYINGVAQTLSHKNNPTSLSTSWDENSLFSIGGFPSNTNYDCTDTTVIDEVRIYKRALTQSEINEVANEHKVPTLKGEVVSNTYTRMSWASDILPEDILWSIGYEEGEEVSFSYAKDPYGDVTGGQKIVTTEKFSGLRSRYSRKTSDGTGNKYDYPNTSGTQNYAVFNKFALPDSSKGAKVVVTSRVKTTADKVGLYHYTTWNWGKSFINYSGVQVAEAVSSGSKTLKLTSLSGIAKGGTICFDDDVNTVQYVRTIMDVDTSTKIVTLDGTIPKNLAVGYQIKRRPMRFALSFNSRTHSVVPNQWTLISDSATIDSSTDISYWDNPQSFRELIVGYGDTYTDDIKVGYATKVRLYRDNSKVYEGYDAFFDDKSATDKATPTSVSEINSTMEVVNANNSTRKINISFKEGKDNGTTYKYQVSAISKDGIETPLSKTNTQTVTSGVKGYSYVIDKNPLTIPSNTVNVTTNKISHNITDSGVYYLHIKTIDNAGNVSGTVHYKIDVPTITAKANSSEDTIRLDWTMNDLKNKTFKVYKKREGESNFQSISMTNLDTSKQVRVLNIYPTYNVPLKTDGSVDINNKPMHQSAMLNEWIEDYGMGVITVDSINKEDFENDPNKWLKDDNGEYKYDVVVVGFWNISVRQQHLNNTGSDAIGEFIDSGRGVLAGHHHIGYREFDYGLNRLKTKFGVKLIKEQGAYQTELGNIDYVLPETSPGSDNSYYWNLGTQVKATKKGILLNYPHNIAQEGKIFTVPKGHDTWEFAMGDVWMQYVNQNAYVSPYNLPAKDITMLPDGSAGTSNVYLHTYNNTAIIQTGHSNNNATEDEKKIVANTIFYLNQLSTDNFLNDNSGQDVTAPNKPVITGHTFTSRGNVEVKFNEVTDNGSEYSYYVQSEDRNGQVSISNTVTETITSGMKGYSYVVDSNPNTIPDTTIELTKAQPISVSITDNSAKYVHIRAIDNVGNGSETYHYKITESTKPTMTITGNPTNWTNSDVTLRVSGDDLDSGVDYIVLPNGNMVAGEFASYTVTANGNYTFKVVDKMGNITTQTVSVTKIDKTSPNLTYTKVVNSAKTQADITLSFNDTASGFDYLELPNGTKVTNVTTHTYTTTENGSYLFTAYDKVGNKTTLSVQVFDLNSNVYPSDVSRIEYKLSGATVQDWTNYTTPFYITNEGITTITSRSYDKAGNVSSEQISTVKIDKTKPNNSSILIQLK